MPPLFFVPGAQAVTAELLKSHGLDRLLPPSVASRHTFNGPPGGAAGMIITTTAMDADRITFAADKQTWSKRFGKTSLVGTWNDSPVTPEDLARPARLDGADVKLVDGHHWHVPVLRKWNPATIFPFRCQLPQIMQQCTETGRWLLTDVVPQYAELWQDSLKIGEALFEQLRGSDSAELEVADVFGFAAQLLAVNYHVDASVLSHLKNLQPELAGEIVRIALDWQTLRDHLKNAVSRLDSSGTNTDSGATQPTAA